jgi:hypothetical protein
MRIQNKAGGKRWTTDRGWVLLTMATSAFALFGAVDIGRVLSVKSEVQACFNPA